MPLPALRSRAVNSYVPDPEVGVNAPLNAVVPLRHVVKADHFFVPARMNR